MKATSVITIKREGKGGNWAIYLDGKLVEGGFFTYAGAVKVAEEYR